MPLVSKSFSDIITFTRASTATFFNSSGVLTSAAINVARLDYNPATLAARGLLIEEQRTNLLLNNATLSTQSVTVSAVAYTLSFYGTGTITLSGASTAGPLVGSGVFPNRVTLTFTPTAGTLTLTVSGTVQHAQLEAGAFATSVIPTTTTALTRNADVASVNTLSPWYNASEGTTYFEGVTFDTTSGNFPRAYQFNDGTNNNVIQITRNNGSGAARMSVVSGSVSQAAADATAWTLNATTKAALAYATNNFAIVANGGAVTTDTSGTVPTVTNLLLGSQVGGVAQLNGWVRRITYYPRRLSNAELQAITA